ncbi:ssk1 response regulator receiver [Pleurotus pulmonarius]|nr:ssk1 response regulator receiver [Pleurotus pulmonarius]
MSWTGSYPPPPRRSRSRSPSRGSYPPRSSYGDPHYPPDQYRADWDTYDRDRWAYYERDRPGYDYGRRGRSRSPPPDEFSRKRRRSPSPFERDRYEPRPRFNDDYDAPTRHGYSSPPRRGNPGPYPSSRRPPADPHLQDYPASLKQYAEWFRYYYPQAAIDEDNADKAAEQEAGDGSKPRNGIKARWENYKKDFAATQLQTMFEHHKKSPWFAEKYDPAPEFANLRLRVRKEGWKGRIDAFLLDLESSKFDPDSQESAQQSSPTVDNSTNGEQGGDTNGAGDEGKVNGADDEMQFAMDGDEDAGDPDAAKPESNGKSLPQDARRMLNRGEEISTMPEGNQVTIRTIPPDIGRMKLEDALCKMPGFKYLALGDPMQKRNYYRAGWIRFNDDADMSVVMSDLSEKKIEGFKLHVTHNTRPFTAKIRCTPEIASRPERLEKDLANIKTLAAILEEEAAKLRTTKVKKVTVAKTSNEAASADVDAPMEDAGDDIMEDDPEPREKGSDAVERRIEKVMFDLREQGVVDINDEKAYEEKKVSISLDMYCAYLRAAYHTCYYCALVADHIEELQRKCVKHERKPCGKVAAEEAKDAGKEKDVKANEESAEAKDPAEKDVARDKEREKNERWLEWHDSKIALLINRDGVDPHDYGGKRYQEELAKVLEPFIKQEDEGKFRCKTCQKLFKATSFVEKHIANKHPEHTKGLEEIPYFNNFALDPHRIQPFVHPPQLLGSGQPPPPQAYGIQAPVYHGGSGGGGDYGRTGGGGQFVPQMTYPPLFNNGWDMGGFPPNSYQPLPQPMRRDEATTARRLSDRITGFAPGSELSTLPPAIGLPPKPSAAALDSALQAGNTGRRGGRGAQAIGPPPPPPPDAKEDPRAAAGKRMVRPIVKSIYFGLHVDSGEALRVSVPLQPSHSQRPPLIPLQIPSPAMSGPRLPAVRLASVSSNEGEAPSIEGVLLSPSRFGYEWTTEADGSLASVGRGYGENDIDGEAEEPSGDVPSDEQASPLHNDEFQPSSSNILQGTTFQPRFARALSMPLPSQLGHLQNPHRSGPSPSDDSKEEELSRLGELSLELADSVQMMIQTMLQVSPPQMLDPAKEQFSACALAVPTTSMSAMFTTMKSLNYISANAATFCAAPSSRNEGLAFPRQPVNEFDIGELLQNVGDALSGSAAQAGVDLVLYHADVGMKHVIVKGDESGISFALSHIVRQVLSTAREGDSIELGLFINPSKQLSERDSLEDGDVHFLHRSTPVDLDHLLQCTIDVGHKFAMEGHIPMNRGALPARATTSFNSSLLKRLLSLIDASLETDLPPITFSSGRVCQLHLELERSPSMTVPPTISPLNDGDEGSAPEPSIEQLAAFAETLRGKKGSLYASSKGSFAHHFTSYLTAWGMDVSHVSADTAEEETIQANEQPALAADAVIAPSPQSPVYGPQLEGYDINGTTGKSDAPLSFIFIDDDVCVLKERLQSLRTEQRFNLTLKKRPPLAPLHRRSTPQLHRSETEPSSKPNPPVVIVHFTSLSRFKIVKDLIQSMVSSYNGSTSPIPEVMIIPKPAGPRRFLTALHTAVTKPIVDPFFVPIATSPMTPGMHLSNSFFPYVPLNQTQPSIPNRPTGSRSNSDKSTKSNREFFDHSHVAPSSPLARPDNIEYFSQAADQFGTSPASGVVIQSPDGQPHGIFFHPKGKSQRQLSSGLAMERDKGHLAIPVSRRSSSAKSNHSDSAQRLSFSTLHEMVSSQQSPNTPTHRSSQKVSSPRIEEPMGPPHTMPRKMSMSDVALRKSPVPASPPAGISPGSRRPMRRRPTVEAKSPTAMSRKKAKTTDGIVPPVKVLIVEDNPINQTILSTFMKKKKITYDVAENGLEAVEKWRTGSFHLILMDIQMPVMDGLEATKEIRRLEKSNAMAGFPPTPLGEDGSLALRTPSESSSSLVEARSSPYRSSVIIVALTASSMQRDRVTALAAGCNDFLTKPVSLKWLENKIIEWGSIKALQMWADLRPDVLRRISSGQAAQARSIADRLHVPKDRVATPSPSRPALTNGDHNEPANPVSASEEENVPTFADSVVGLMRSSSTSSNTGWRKGTGDSIDDMPDGSIFPLMEQQESPTTEAPGDGQASLGLTHEGRQEESDATGTDTSAKSAQTEEFIPPQASTTSWPTECNKP